MFWRRRLPHWVSGRSIVFVTWRLAGSLPPLEPEFIRQDPDPGRTFVQWDRRLDRADSGPVWLVDPRIAGIFVEALLYGESGRGSYELFAWVVMSNHVHLVLRPVADLSDGIRWLKTATAKRANRLLNRTGEAFWQREYFDRWIRSEKEFASVVAYVESNPVKAGLVGFAGDWRWSSGFQGTGDKIAGATSVVLDVGEVGEVGKVADVSGGFD